MLDRIKETTSTAGTGAYTLSGTAAEGYTTVLAADAVTGFGARALPYVVTDGVDWEVGYGVFDGVDQFTRAVIMSSSNGHVEVDWGAGEKTFMIAPGAASSGLNGVRCNFSASDSPDNVIADETVGYGPGSLWVVGNENGVAMIYLCTDGVTPVWTRIINSQIATTSYSGNALHVGFPDSTAGARPVTGLVIDPQQGNLEGKFGKVTRLAETLHTPSDTPDTIEFTIDWGVGLATGTIVVITSSEVLDDHVAAAWTFQAAYRTEASTPWDVEIVGSPTITEVFCDAALSATDVGITINGSGQLTFTLTGVTAVPLDWQLSLELNELIQFEAP